MEVAPSRKNYGHITNINHHSQKKSQGSQLTAIAPHDAAWLNTLGLLRCVDYTVHMLCH